MPRKSSRSKVQVDQPSRKRHVHTLAGMADACDKFTRSFSLNAAKRTSAFHDPATRAATVSAMLGNDAGTLAKVVSVAESLADQAAALDPRLTARPGWTRAEEGLEIDVASFMAGDPDCCLARVAKRRKDQQAAGQVVRVVVSTDSPDVTPAAAAAFIASAKLAAQFVQLEIWWQGSWLYEKDGNAGERIGNGHVFLVPLVSAGSLDFSRLFFILCHPYRDSVSNRIVQYHGLTLQQGWGKGLLEHSALPDTGDFVPASGIEMGAQNVAARAAKWAGFEPLWLEEWQANRDSAQTWEPSKKERAALGMAGDEETPSDVKITDADRRRWAREEKQEAAERTRQARKQAADRAARVV